MPYILKEDRARLDDAIKTLAEKINPDQRAGDLNYAITRLMLLLKGDGKYKDHNELVGMLECCKQEFYRRHVAPYEDVKIEENGDVS